MHSTDAVCVWQSGLLTDSNRRACEISWCAGVTIQKRLLHATLHASPPAASLLQGGERVAEGFSEGGGLL